MRDAGMQVLPLIARPGEPLNPIFENLTGKRVDALLIQGSIARKDDLAIRPPISIAQRGSGFCAIRCRPICAASRTTVKP
jgi:hypothetical protein